MPYFFTQFYEITSKSVFVILNAVKDLRKWLE